MKRKIVLVFLLLGTSRPGCAALYRFGHNESTEIEAASSQQEPMASVSFADKHFVRPDEPIELTLSRALKPEERLGVFIGTTDVTSLFTQDKLHLRYNAKLRPLPVGESTVTAYLVSSENEWKEIARFGLRVEKDKAFRSQDSVRPESGFAPEERDVYSSSKIPAPSSVRSEMFFGDGINNRGRDCAPLELRGLNCLAHYKYFVPTGLVAWSNSFSDDQQPSGSPQSSTAAPQSVTSNGGQAAKSNNHKMKFTPSLTLTMPSQPAQSTFPGPQPERATFIELNLQASLKNEATYGIFSTQSTFDFAGSSFEKEALRFGTLGNSAPKVDLSSYLVHLQTGKVKYDVGHFTYGTQRQLINGFSSRGIQITVPFLKRFDFSAAAMNGTQLVGYDNFFGLSKRKHQMLSGTLGIEVLPKRPGGLRVEVGVLSAYFQPISGVNRGVVTDLQRSRGIALRLIASDKGGRFHFEGGFTRSFFASPSDQSLIQGVNVVALPNLTRNAHYLETSYEILKNHSLTKTKKANLNVAFKEENIAPLFRTLGASTQADKIQYEVSVNGSINEITAQFGHANFHDNLRRIPSILRSLTGNTHLGLAAPASALLNRTKNSAWLPRLGYSFDRVHQFGAAIPVNGGFELDPSTVPNLLGTNQTFTADWQVKKFTWGYNVNRSFQDNQQKGREHADQGVLVHTGRIGIAATTKLNFNLDLSRESSANKETGRIDRTYRLGPGVTWQLTKHMGLTANLGNTIAGDAAKTSHSRNTEFDASWTYRFEHGKEGLKKFSGQFFIRYANHYSHAFERLLVSDTMRKNQTLTANLGITFF